jgi:glycosyltransferase involved in cell wall biosynthesis
MSGVSVHPAISVIMAVRDAGRFLEPALQSLADQTFKNYELILVDNNSRDGTERIASAWADQDQRIRLYRSQSLGLARCLNFAATHARAPLLARLDGDDMLLPERLARQHARLMREPEIGLLGACVDVIDKDDNLIGRRHLPSTDTELRQFLRKGNPFVHSTIMMRRPLFEAVGGYRAGLRICEDFDLWCRMAEITEIANEPDILARYRIHESSMSAARPVRVAIADACIIAAARARHDGKPEPFVSGSPNLRAALAILDIPRDEFKYRALKNLVGVSRLALARGDIALARDLRRRAHRQLRGLSRHNVWRGLARVIASYFPSGTRERRKALLTRLLGMRAKSGPGR